MLAHALEQVWNAEGTVSATSWGYFLHGEDIRSPTSVPLHRTGLPVTRDLACVELRAQSRGQCSPLGSFFWVGLCFSEPRVSYRGGRTIPAPSPHVAETIEKHPTSCWRPWLGALLKHQK